MNHAVSFVCLYEDVLFFFPVIHDTSLNATGAGCIARSSIPQRKVIDQTVKVFDLEGSVSVDKTVRRYLSEVGIFSERVVRNTEILRSCADAEETPARDFDQSDRSMEYIALPIGAGVQRRSSGPLRIPFIGGLASEIRFHKFQSCSRPASPIQNGGAREGAARYYRFSTTGLCEER